MLQHLARRRNRWLSIILIRIINFQGRGKTQQNVKGEFENFKESRDCFSIPKTCGICGTLLQLQNFTSRWPTYCIVLLREVWLSVVEISYLSENNSHMYVPWTRECLHCCTWDHKLWAPTEQSMVLWTWNSNFQCAHQALAMQSFALFRKVPVVSDVLTRNAVVKNTSLFQSGTSA